MVFGGPRQILYLLSSTQYLCIWKKSSSGLARDLQTMSLFQEQTRPPALSRLSKMIAGPFAC